jgi:ABC-type uncharacterized transport system permease subunit
MLEGVLPIHYLGVPLTTKKLSLSNCATLMEKISGRINSWLSRHFFLVGRLQLISSVLFSIQIYWFNIFILPKKVIRLIEQKFNWLLWNENDSSSTKAKVS